MADASTGEGSTSGVLGAAHRKTWTVVILHMSYCHILHAPEDHIRVCSVGAAERRTLASGRWRLGGRQAACGAQLPGRAARQRRGSGMLRVLRGRDEAGQLCHGRHTEGRRRLWLHGRGCLGGGRAEQPSSSQVRLKQLLRLLLAEHQARLKG